MLKLFLHIIGDQH